MRTLLLAVLLASIAAPASAACPLITDPNWAREIQNQTARSLCLGAQTSSDLMQKARDAQLRAEFQLQLNTLETQQRLQQELTAPAPVALPPLPSFP